MDAIHTSYTDDLDMNGCIIDEWSGYKGKGHSWTCVSWFCIVSLRICAPREATAQILTVDIDNELPFNVGMLKKKNRK